MRRVTSGLTGALVLVVASAAWAQRGEVAPTWNLVEDLRIGEDAGPKSFNDVRSVVATKNGNIFVLDFKTKEIRLFDATGRFLKLVSRDGAGPGEIRNANGLAIGADDMVWVNDPANGRFSQFNANGQFVKQQLMSISGFGYVWNGAIADGGKIIDPSVTVAKDPNSDEREPRIRIIDPSGKADTVAYPSCTATVPGASWAFHFERRDKKGNSYRQIPFLPRPQMVITRNGQVWCTPQGEYRLFVGPVGGALKEVVNLKIAPPPVSDGERKRELEIIDSLKLNYGPLISGDPQLIPKTKPTISRIFTDDQSRVWVRRTDTPDAKPTFDVFDASGRMVARVNSAGKIHAYQTFIAGGYVYSAVTDADDVPTIVRYRIVR